MKYTHKLPDTSVNVTQKNVLLETFMLLGMLLLIGLLSYALMLQSLDYVVSKITPQQEKKLVDMIDISAGIGEEKHDSYLQALTDKLATCANLPYEIETYLVENTQRNAFALPSGKIYITRGMLEEVQNENELVGIIGHELGHFKHRDHLKGFGNAMILAFLSLALDSKYGLFFESSLKLSKAKYSQKAEYDADRFGLEVMQCGYGTVRGATTLFSRMDDGKKWLYFLQTHPDFASRIEKMKSEIVKKSNTKKGRITALKKRF